NWRNDQAHAIGASDQRTDGTDRSPRRQALMPLRSVRYTGGTSTREDRLLAIDTPLGEDKLVLTEFAGEEEISQPFTFFATLRSEDADIKPGDLIGSKVTI